MTTKKEKLKEALRRTASDWVGEQIVRLGNYSQVVETGIRGRYYARQNNGKVIEVHNTLGIPPTFDLRVIVRRSRSQPLIWRISEVLEDYLEPVAAGQIANHHEQHEESGSDRLVLDRKQIKQLSVRAAGNFTVKVYGAPVLTPAGVFFVNNQTLDLSSYNILTSGAAYVAIETNTSGVLSTQVGTAFLAPELGTAADIPTPEEGKYTIAFVLIYTGQTELTDDHIKLVLPLPGGGSAHTHIMFNDAEGDPENISNTEPDPGASSFAARRDHIHYYEDIFGPGGVVVDDLSPQIPAAGDHFDLVDEAGEVLLFFNGVFQSSSFYTMDLDNLGLTTDFSPVAGDSLVAIYGITGVVGFYDAHAIHDNASNEFAGIPEKTTLHGNDRALIEDSEDSYSKKWIKQSLVTNFKINYDTSLTIQGQNWNRSSGGSYQYHRGYITVFRPIHLESIVWDIYQSGTYRVRLFRGWQISSHMVEKTEEVVGSGPWGFALDAYLFPGHYVLEQYRSTSVSPVHDHTNDASPTVPLVFSFYQIERTQYDNTFDLTFSPAFRLEAYLGTEVIY